MVLRLSVGRSIVALKWVTHRLTGVGSRAAFTPTRTKSSAHKYRIESCCVANSLHYHSSSRYCFFFVFF